MPRFKPVIITTTTATLAQAEHIGALLLSKQLAGCVQYESIRSQYLWEGKICDDEETRIIIKTSRCRYAAIEKIILQNHSYDCPQIMMLPVHRGHKPYLKWLKESIGC